MTATNKIFKLQIWHLISLIILILSINIYVSDNSDVLEGSFLSVDTKSWFWLAVAVPIIHQVYVWLVWRFELYQRTFTQKFGVKRAFNIYSTGFSMLFVCRLIAIIVLAISRQRISTFKPRNFLPFCHFNYSASYISVLLSQKIFYSRKSLWH